MKAKKSKDLVDDLIGDLMSDDKTAPLPTVGNTKSATGTAATAASKVSPTITKSTFDESTGVSEPDVRTTVGKFALRSSSRPAGTLADAALVQSENLRVAQQRIFELEQEIERLRQETEQLAAAGDSVRKRLTELQIENDRHAQKIASIQERAQSEKEHLEQSVQAKERLVQEQKLKIQELETRLTSNFQKIRVRERELENRLELIKMESSAVVRNKDEVLLELKRQIDQLQIEIENYRSKGQDLHKQLTDKQESQRRTVKALRLALSMLEGGAEEAEALKKAK